VELVNFHRPEVPTERHHTAASTGTTAAIVADARCPTVSARPVIVAVSAVTVMAPHGGPDDHNHSTEDWHAV
jgi:hypothetical protein